MRSINTKRIAAIAAGAAMVGSVLATGLAVEKDPAQISAYVNQIKQNLNDVSVVVGSGAQLSDGISAAKIAAKLTALNYEELTEVPNCEVDTSALTCTGGEATDAKVSLSSTSAGLTEGITSTEYNAVLTRSAGNMGAYSTQYKNITVEPPGMLPDVFSQRTLSVTEGGTTKQYTYKEMLKLGYGTYSGDNTGLKASYAEDWSTGDYGLYLKARYGDIIYRLDFGNGFPLNATYDTYPEIVMLGKTYAIGTQSSQYGSGKITLLSGNRYYMQAGEEQTVGDYTVTLNSVGITSSNNVAATVTVTGPTGSDTRQLSVGGSYDFFDGAVSVLVESAAQAAYTGTNQATGTATLRIGTGSIKLQDNTAFPLDPAWTVAKVNVTSDGTYYRLYYIDIKYGDSQNPGQYDYQGTTVTGLKQGTIIPGPKNADGESVFNIQLAGLEQVDNTDVTFEGYGVAGTNDGIKVKYVDRSGNENYFDATPLTAGNFSTGSDATLIDMQPGFKTFVNDKVVEFVRLGDRSSDNTQQDVVLKIAGVEQTYTLTNVTGGLYNLTSAKYNTIAYPIDCKLSYNPSNGHLQIIDTLGDDISASNTDSYACDLFPNYIPVGNKLIMDKTNNPNMDLTGILGNRNVYYTNTTYLQLPFAKLKDAGAGASDAMAIVFDSNTSSGSNAGEDTYTGFEVYQNVSDVTGGAINVTGQSKYVYQDASTAPDKYEITAFGTTIDASETNKVKFNLAEEGRDTILQITGKAITGNETKQIQELGIGDEAWGVKVEDITATTTGAQVTGEATCTLGDVGTLYQQTTSGLLPENFVITDQQTPATYQIVIGGPIVNSQAAGVPGIDELTAAGQSKIVVDGTKIVIAGYTATDTEDAVNEFLNYLA